MAENVQVCDISDDVIQRMKKFRLRKEKDIAAIILKVDKSTTTVIIDEEFQDITIEELQEELPSHLPRYLVLSYVQKHSDGRVSYPLCFVYICPAGTKPELAVMYAGTKTYLQKQLEVTKIFELRSAEEFTEEWLIQKLSFFR